MRKNTFDHKTIGLAFCLSLQMLFCISCARGQTSKTTRAVPEIKSEQPDAPTPASSNEAPADERQIKELVDKIKLIDNLPPKLSQPFNGKYAKEIIELGEKAAPYLAAKITDASNSNYSYLFRHKVGDVALILLQKIYQTKNFPFPDDSEKLPSKYGDYRDYTKFMRSAKARKRLQNSWKNYIAQQKQQSKS